MLDLCQPSYPSLNRKKGPETVVLVLFLAEWTTQMRRSLQMRCLTTQFRCSSTDPALTCLAMAKRTSPPEPNVNIPIPENLVNASGLAKRLSEREEFYRGVLDSLAQGVIITDSQSR